MYLIKVKTKGTPLWGTPLGSMKTLSFATITNVIGSAVKVTAHPQLG